MKIIDCLYDQKSECFSLMTTMLVSEYMQLVSMAYEKKGGLEGQRDRLTTTSALRIRKRMTEDFKDGAVLPPVVVGILATVEQYKLLEVKRDEGILPLYPELKPTQISIIDGMQRTTIFIENQTTLAKREIRVEFWIATKTANLTYRMLVLNTGQVPWNLRRQMEVIYSSLLSELESVYFVGDTAPIIKLYHVGEGGRRTRAGEFQANDVIELYIAFGLRKSKVDTESVLADEFSRLDMIDAVSNRLFFYSFAKVFLCLCKLDIIFESASPAIATGKFSNGRHLFDSQPACVGFITAAAQKIYGRPGSMKKIEDQTLSSDLILQRCDQIVDSLMAKTPEEIRDFLALDLLSEVLASRTGKKIGDLERDFFTEAFRVFLSEDVPLESMIPCWRAF